MNWLARLKTLLIEFCHDCGRRVDRVWTCDDALWAELVQDQGPRCIACINKRAVTAGLFVRWVPNVEYRWTP